MVQNAERVETEVESFARMIAQRSRKLLGMIRVTTNDVLADCLLTPWLREFTQRFPVVQVETIITDRRLDISRGEADIALRANTTKGPPLGEGVDHSPARRRASGGFTPPRHTRPKTAPRAIAENWRSIRSSPVPASWRGSIPAFLKEAKSQRRGDPAGFVLDPQHCRGDPFRPRRRRHSLHAGRTRSRAASSASCSTRPIMTFTLITREEMRNLPHVRAFNDFIASRTSALRHMIEGRTQNRQ